MAILAIAVWKSIDTINKARKNPRLNLQDLNFYSKLPFIGDEFKFRYANKLERAALIPLPGEKVEDVFHKRNVEVEALFRELADKGNQKAEGKAKHYKKLIDQHLKKSS
ncbi:MAG: hypothetical protein GWP59_03670 [Chlamydiales bacterium]|nr:hypothetical protein [Chlamydiales bacterium]